jgi:hypothetical protein
MVLALAFLMLPFSVWADPWPSLAIPSQNLRTATSPTPRPPPGDIEVRARHLVDALRTGATSDVENAMDFFLPRDPFLAIKDMSGAAGYFNTLTRTYRRDIAAYRTEVPSLSGASFVRFELSRACTWMAAGREANRLPYWSCYRSRLVVRTNGRDQSLEVRVMINWGDHWYVTHLRPWH